MLTFILSSCSVLFGSPLKSLYYIEGFNFHGYNGVHYIQSQPKFQRNIWQPFPRLNSTPSKKFAFAARFMLVSYLAYSSTTIMEAKCHSETSVGFIGLHTVTTLHKRLCVNLRS
jgi:hypothetical protein